MNCCPGLPDIIEKNTSECLSPGSSLFCGSPQYAPGIMAVPFNHAEILAQYSVAFRVLRVYVHGIRSDTYAVSGRIPYRYLSGYRAAIRAGANRNLKGVTTNMNFSQTSQNVQIQLYDNPILNSGRSTCVGRVKPRGSVSIGDLARDVSELGSEIHESILVSAATQILEAAFDRVKRGFSVDLEICHVKLGVQGVFDASSSRFDTEVNNISLLCTPTARAVDALKCVHVQKIEKKNVSPHITGVSPCIGNPDRPVRSGDLIGISGKKIKISGVSSDNGVWFVRGQSNSHIRVKADDLVINKPSFLQVIVPPLDDGLWYVEVVTQYVHASNTTKAPRSCKYTLTLCVKNGKFDGKERNRSLESDSASVLHLEEITIPVAVRGETFTEQDERGKCYD